MKYSFYCYIWFKPFVTSKSHFIHFSMLIPIVFANKSNIYNQINRQQSDETTDKQNNMMEIVRGTKSPSAHEPTTMMKGSHGHVYVDSLRIDLDIKQLT